MSLHDVTVTPAADRARQISPTRHTTTQPPSRSDAPPTAGVPLAPDRSAAAPDRHATVRAGAPRLSVVIPTYNEGRTIGDLLNRIPRDVHEVIVVDGHSLDGTVAVARSVRPDVRVVLQNRFGKGNALMCGVGAATGDIVVMLDADGSTDPGGIPGLVSALMDGADFSRDSRSAGTGNAGAVAVCTRWMNRLAQTLLGGSISLGRGCDALWRDRLDRLGLHARPDARRRSWGDGWEIDLVIGIRLARAGMRVAEVVRPDHARREVATLDSWLDFARAFGVLVVEGARAAGWPGPALPLRGRPKQPRLGQGSVCRTRTQE